MRPLLYTVLLLGALLPMAASCGEARGTLVTTGGDGGAGTWRPPPGSTWQVQLSGTLDTSLDVAVYDVDLFTTSSTEMAGLHADGRRVICYVSVGTHEPWRADATMFPAPAVGNPLVGYPNESWLDTRDATVRALMAARLDVAAQKACDGVDLSNVSVDGADSGFPLAAADSMSYARFLAVEGHRRGLSVGLGGSSDIAASVEPDFEWAFTDSCLASATCGSFAGFVTAHKTVFAVEFGTAADVPTICPPARQAGLDALIKNRSFDAFRVPCP
jgi:Glycoside-hydrolase family GH114